MGARFEGQVWYLFWAQEGEKVPPKVSIIVLNWNRLAHTMECLDSLKKITYAYYDVVVVDNGSKGDDVSVLRGKYGDYVHLIQNKKNFGFAKGNNVGIRYALQNSNPRYVLLLNNDTVVDSQFLTELTKVAERDERIGSCQSKIMSMKDPKIIDAIGVGIFRRPAEGITAYPTFFLDGHACQIGYLEKDKGQYDQEREVFGPCACSVLCRREMLEQIGLFDEDFFAYFEDVDLAWRARLFGWKCMYVPTSLVYHVSSATGASIKTYYLARNLTYYVLKNAPRDIVYRHMIRLLVSFPMTLILGLKHRDYRNMLKMLRGKLDIFCHIPKMLKKRRELQSARLVPDSEIERWFF